MLVVTEKQRVRQITLTHSLQHNLYINTSIYIMSYQTILSYYKADNSITRLLFCNKVRTFKPTFIK